MNIAFVAGKSGGHIIPCLTLASNYKQKDANTQTLFFSTAYPLDMQLIAKHPEIDQHIAQHLPSISYYNPFSCLRGIWQLITAYRDSRRILKKHAIDRIISTGGYNALATCLAAYTLRIPIELWELNVEPGKALRLLAPLAENINICFAQTKTYLKKYHCTLAPYPLRFKSADKGNKEQACHELSLDPKRFTLFILGGSQGSRALNDTIKHILKHAPHLAQYVQCIHQTGTADLIELQNWYRNQQFPALVFDYRNDVSTLYNAADLVISRAGAGALFELAFFEKSCLIFPLNAQTTTHQVLNAQAFIQQYPRLGVMIAQDQQKNYARIAQHILDALHTT